MEKESYTITEAMPIFGVSRSTITHWISAGIIDAKKQKGIWRIDGRSVSEWQEFQALGLPAAKNVIRKKFGLL
ncbi:helix-turn-helix domain-containing protein [Planococcus shenhongbingii]|uniref:helix-turn-helix domain-containing protein n=1 Tax=Planococcus shenhongbingii TaxID=3058398 RepID=UPI002619795C|nr:helix-turn-helix domain-containing protein [Planococcus sp. N016]WKA60225.1 helix-turn-helix domain-containing protein [Planococcus sp. N016]